MATSTSPAAFPRLQPVLLGIGFLLLIGLSAATAFLVDRSATDAQRLAHTLTVQDKFSNLLLNVRRAESGQRGFLFTNNTEYLEDFFAAEPATAEIIKELRTLTADNPARKGQIDAIAELTSARFAEMRRIIALMQAGQQDTARREVARGEGRRVMNNLRDHVFEAIADEGRLLALRTEQSRNTNRLLLVLALMGSGLIITIGGISVAMVQRNARQRESARAELAGMNANLERIVNYRTADLTEANEEIQRFAYIVSHDLRSPLVNIMGFTSELEALRKDIFEKVNGLTAELATLKAQAAEAAEAEPNTEIDRLGEDFDEAIRFIKTSIGNMDRLINAVLKLSREGRRQFSPEQIDMKAMLEAVVENVAHRAAEQGAELTVGDLPPVESDRLALEQVFANLVDNALKYSRSEEPLRIAIAGRINGTQVVYEVQDNGRGIDPHDHQRIFELFRRSGRQDRPGEGIGLAHVRALVRRLGGSMGLNSELGKGSTFIVTLPRRWSVDKGSVT
ncbi:MAG: CHASE3 domain-containing protein [Pseudolabrys sp.]|nr:CHASE3 domain-containing protein [Pseudolabrys sp.]